MSATDRSGASRLVRRMHRWVRGGRSTRGELEATVSQLEHRVRRLRRQRNEARSLHKQAKGWLAAARDDLVRTRAELRVPPFQWWRISEDLVSRDRGLERFWFFPGLNHNPVLSILYSRMPEFGFDPRPLPTLEDLASVGPGSILHLHWPRLVGPPPSTVEEARSEAGVVLGLLEAFVGAGGVLLWTIHEPLRHDALFPEVEREMRVQIAAMATAIHLLHPSTLDAVGDLYTVDASKTVVVPQPLYVGYADYVGRVAARRQLGFGDDEVVLVSFGAIGPYKGFDRVLRRLPEIRRGVSRDVRLMIAGPALDGEHVAMLRRLAETTPGVSISDTPVSRDAAQILLRAADLAVYPYRKFHNSGSLMLSLEFGLPAVVSSNPVIEDLVDSGLVVTFDGSSDDDMVRALVESIERIDTFPAELPTEFAQRHSPHRVGGEFARRVRGVVDEVTGR